MSGLRTALWKVIEQAREELGTMDSDLDEMKADDTLREEASKIKIDAELLLETLSNVLGKERGMWVTEELLDDWISDPLSCPIKYGDESKNHFWGGVQALADALRERMK